MAKLKDNDMGIRINNLCESTTENDLDNLVKPFGPILKSYLAIHEETGLCKGFATVDFKFTHDAETVILTLNGYNYKDLTLDVNWAKFYEPEEIKVDTASMSEEKDESSICIANLSQSIADETNLDKLVKPLLSVINVDGTKPCVEEAIKKPVVLNKEKKKDHNRCIHITNFSESTTATDVDDLVKPFGPIRKRNLAKQNKTGLCKGFAYVHFKYRKHAARAISMLHGHSHNGHILNVDWSKPLVQTKRAEAVNVKRKKNNNASIRITNLTESSTETDLKNLVKPFGPLQKLYLAKDKQTGLCKGFAYVHFKFRNDAAKAISMLNRYGYNHLLLNVDWSKSLEIEATKVADDVNVAGRKDDLAVGCTKLYESIAEAHLENRVKPFGPVRNRYLKKNRSGRNKPSEPLLDDIYVEIIEKNK